MRLVRFGEKGCERPGLDKEDGIVDLRAVFPDIPDLGPEFFEAGWMGKIAGAKGPLLAKDVRLGCPVTRPEKIICLGKNYAEHAAEGNMKKPVKPLLFSKTANALNGPRDPIVLPLSSGQLDWEVELAVIIGKRAKRISPEYALDVVAAFCVMNDVSAREAQFSDKQWFRGKSLDGFAPLGPALVSPDEAGDWRELVLESRVNGRLMQQARAGDMLFSIPEILSFISQDITLAPGDVISCGTPAGVGVFRNPPIFLKAGDMVECGISSIGLLQNRVVKT